MGTGFKEKEKKIENEMIIYDQKCLLNVWAFLLPYIHAVNQYLLEILFKDRNRFLKQPQNKKCYLKR